MTFLLFLLMLPVSVYLYACVLAIFDASNKVRATSRLVISLIVLLLFALLVSRSIMPPLLMGFCFVVTLHWLAFFLVRHLGLGMPVYQNHPPPDALDIEHEEESDQGNSTGQQEVN